MQVEQGEESRHDDTGQTLTGGALVARLQSAAPGQDNTVDDLNNQLFFYPGTDFQGLIPISDPTHSRKAATTAASHKNKS